jgi:hypothetical protein
MSCKKNWACDACGMASGRKESVQRHIDNPRIHNGNAIVIPYELYIARLAGGAYPYNIHDSFKQKDARWVRDSYVQHANESFLDKIEVKIEEKLVDKIAQEAVYRPFLLPPPILPMPNINYLNQQAFFNYPGEKIFGIEGYICEHCLIIKPTIYLYGIDSNEGSSQSLIYPVQYCHRNRDYSSSQEQMDYISYNEKYGFPKVLRNWVSKMWSRGQNMKLVSLQVHRANMSNMETYAFNGAGERLISSTDCNNNPDIGNRGIRARITVECVGNSGVRKFISLPYDDSNAIQLNATHTFEKHPSVKSTRVSSTPILRVRRN